LSPDELDDPEVLRECGTLYGNLHALGAGTWFDGNALRSEGMLLLPHSHADSGSGIGGGDDVHVSMVVMVSMWCLQINTMHVWGFRKEESKSYFSQAQHIVGDLAHPSHAPCAVAHLRRA